MARNESAFNTDDPVLIRVGELFRQSIAESWQADRLVVELQGVLMPLIPRPENKVIVASTPTFATLSAGQLKEHVASTSQALADNVKRHGLPPARALTEPASEDHDLYLQETWRGNIPDGFQDYAE